MGITCLQAFQLMTTEKECGCTQSDRTKVVRRFVSRSIKHAASFFSLFDNRCSLHRADVAQIAGYSNTLTARGQFSKKQGSTLSRVQHADADVGSAGSASQSGRAAAGGRREADRQAFLAGWKTARHKIGECSARHRSVEFRRFLDRVVDAVSDGPAKKREPSRFPDHGRTPRSA